MSTKMITKFTFALTFEGPIGLTIPQLRELIKLGLQNTPELGIKNDADVKVHLTNKETSYGKR